nr:hypothetical protein [uncultured Desulfobulbus sp.]
MISSFIILYRSIPKKFFAYHLRRKSIKLFIGSLPYNIVESELSDLFGQFGSVVSARLIKDAFSGESKGFGFVEMSSRSEGH